MPDAEDTCCPTQLDETVRSECPPRVGLGIMLREQHGHPVRRRRVDEIVPPDGATERLVEQKFHPSLPQGCDVRIEVVDQQAEEKDTGTGGVEMPLEEPRPHAAGIDVWRRVAVRRIAKGNETERLHATDGEVHADDVAGSVELGMHGDALRLQQSREHRRCGAKVMDRDMDGIHPPR